MIINRIPLSAFNDSVFLTAYLHTREPNRFEPELLRPAVVICPGGAYMGINEAEAEYLSCQFLAAGFQTFVLSYSIGAPYARFPMPIKDLEKAYEHIQANMHLYDIAKGKIALCGLSAGAHLASLANESFDVMLLVHPMLDLNMIGEYAHRTSESTHAMVDMMFASLFGNPSPSHETLKAFSSTSYLSESSPPTLIVKSMADEWSTHAQVNEYLEVCLQFGVETAVITTDHSTLGDYTGNWINEAISWIKSHFRNDL